jgi:formyl-CoA transferase
VRKRREYSKEAIQILDQIFATKSLQEWLDLLQSIGLDKTGFAYSPVFDYIDVLNDPQAQESNYIVSYDHATAGKDKLIGYPVDFSVTPPAIKHAAPEHGQHTEEVLSEFCGLTYEEMAKLRDEGII